MGREGENLLKPLGRLTVAGSALVRVDGGCVPKYIFTGAPGGGEQIRIGLFAAIHGDEPEGAFALVRLMEELSAEPALARGYHLSIYPICNPGGFAAGTRCSTSGKDLNREFWHGSSEPEVQFLENEIRHNAFHGIITLHADDTSNGVYGFVRGATLTQHLLEPALRSAGSVLPINQEALIDGFKAQDGMIWDCYPGVLGSPPETMQMPFEIILETPHAAPSHLQQEAFVRAIKTILAEYPRLLSYAADL